jgi:hypothetical protein
MMKVAKFTADDVANAAVQAIADKRLYVVLPRQGRIFWRLKRFFPNYVCNLLAKDWAKQLAAMEKKRSAVPQSVPEKTAV